MHDLAICYLNKNDGTSLLAFEEENLLILTNGDSLNLVDEFLAEHSGKYIFMALSYDLKNQIEDLDSDNVDNIEFPLGILWTARHVVRINGPEYNFEQGEENPWTLGIVQQFINSDLSSEQGGTTESFKARTTREDYINHVKELKSEIQNGNIYEINYCQEYLAENVEIQSSIATYHRLNNITKAPFSCLFQCGNHSVFSGSPERFMLRRENKLTSEPIKGTIKRGVTAIEDDKLISELKNDPKEISENVMIVDLVRNDLSKIALTGSLNVEELCGIYSFETVHQMISKVSCEIPDEILFSEILNATFPMGSMTGAPKLSAMKLIEKHEDFKRGIYSGSIGYIQPNGDFDLNVIIRSLVYNRSNRKLSCSVGSAITIQSDPEKEYAECETKISVILERMHD